MRRRVDWCGSGAGVVREVVWSANSGVQELCNFHFLRVSNLEENQTKAVFEVKLIVGWG